MNNEKLLEVFLRIYPGKFHYLKNILEAYDNLAILSSEDSPKGIVRIRFGSESSVEIYALLTSISPHLISSR